ncbi:MAG: kinase [Deltaproteobacteria bacterium]|nr:kinase [Deltaproteobacteria bacterium]
MVISKTPHRISFFGGGSDYPAWYREHGGKVIGVTIDKYSYITCRVLPPFFEHKHKVVYSKVEAIRSFDEIEHPSARETLRYLVNELQEFDTSVGLEIHHDGDIPARAGMGSSSAFTVGLIKSLFALAGKVISKEDLYKMAIHIEQNLIKESVGSQDQVWAALGGLNKIEFMSNGAIVSIPVIINESRMKYLEKRLMLFFTGLSRYATVVAQDQIKNLSAHKGELLRMMEMVDEAYRKLTAPGETVSGFGELLHEAWMLKRGLSTQVSNDIVDAVYEKARTSGATGGKLLGAGGGGFMLFYVEPEKQAAVKTALKDFLHVPFGFEFSGSEIIVYNGR